MSSYLLSEIKEIANRPTLAEMRRRLRRQEHVLALIDTARLIREERDGRSPEWRVATNASGATWFSLHFGAGVAEFHYCAIVAQGIACAEFGDGRKDSFQV